MERWLEIDIPQMSHEKHIYTYQLGTTKTSLVICSHLSYFSLLYLASLPASIGKDESPPDHHHQVLHHIQFLGTYYQFLCEKNHVGSWKCQRYIE